MIFGTVVLKCDGLVCENEVAKCGTKQYGQTEPHIEEHECQHEKVGNEHLHQVEESGVEMARVEHLASGCNQSVP